MPQQKQPTFEPLPAFCFRVTLSVGDKSAEAFFRSVSGLRSEADILPYREGGVNNTVHTFSNGTKWPNLVLKRGFSGDNSFIQWRQSWVEGGGKRANGTISQLNQAGEVVATWSFERGWPAKWELSDLDASKSEISIETLEISHAGLTPGKG